MAAIFNNEKGFKVIEVTLNDCLCLGGWGFCDRCTDKIGKGYYVAVLNWVMCESCFKEWYETAKRYPEDEDFENKVFLKMKRILKL